MMKEVQYDTIMYNEQRCLLPSIVYIVKPVYFGHLGTQKVVLIIEVSLSHRLIDMYIAMGPQLTVLIIEES